MLDFNLSSILSNLLILALPFLAAITVHELAHGYVAYRLGDPTAKNAGRLTLNPLAHLDPLGTITLVLTQFIGWAKPVPVDPRYFKDPMRGMMYSSLAGPVANFLLAGVFAVAFRLVYAYAAHLESIGSPPPFWLEPTVMITFAGVQLNIILGVFNLLPLPPLDGSHILAGVLPPRLAFKLLEFERYGFIVIIILAATGMLSHIIVPVLRFLMPLYIG